MNYILLKNTNIKAIDFEDYLNTISTTCINELHEYNLIQNNEFNIKNQIVRRLLYHNLIHFICEQIMNSNFKIAVIVQPKFKQTQEIYNYCNSEQLDDLLRTILKKIQKMLPVLIIFQEKALDFEILKDKILRDEGEGAELNLRILELSDKLWNKNFTFEQIKKFTNKYGLNFLSHNYFNELKTKQLLFK